MVDNEIEVEVDSGKDPDEYLVRVVRAPTGGEPEARVRLAVGELLKRRQRVEETVLASSARARGGLVAELEQPLRQVGQDLFDALFGGPIAGAYRSSQAVALERGKRLRVVLRLRAPELTVLPWEALWDPDNDSYVCRREPLVRHVPAPSPEPLAVQPPLRILGLVASPRGMPPLDVEAEKHHLDEALANPIAEGQVRLEWEAQASWNRVLDRLLTSQWQVLHFIGHGDYDEITDEGRLALVGTDERADWVEASRLADLLGEAEPTPRLVVLNSCSSGQGGARDLFSGTAATLVRCGISAVAAMQFRVSDRAAVAFPRGFYTALAAGRTVDEAVRSGRIAILGTPHSLEWVTPVLYVRGNATRLFTVTAPAAPPRPPASEGGETTAPAPEPEDVTQDPAWSDALSAFWAGRLSEAVDRFEALDARYPHDGRVRDRLVKARQGRDLAAWYADAGAATQRGDWSSAIEALERIVEVDPTYLDTGKRLEQARTERRRQSLLEEITALHRARQWHAVLAAGDELARLDPDQSDPDGMLAYARQQLGQQDVAARYSDALSHLDAQEWQAAAELFAAIEDDHPGYRDAAVLLATARQHLQRPTASAESTASPAAATAEPPQPHTIQVGQWVFGLAFSPDGTRLATGSRAWIRVWDVRTGQQHWSAKAGGWTDSVNGVAFSPDGTRLATGSGNNTAQIWDATTGKELLSVNPGWVAQVFSVAFSPQGTRLATSSSNKRAQIWDATSRKELLSVRHSDFVRGVAFSPDGTRLATCSDDKTARIWDANTGKELLVVHHTGWVRGVVFSRDGTRFATCSDDKTARIWDANTGKELLAVQHPHPVRDVAFSPDGTRLATGTEDTTAQIWDTTTGKELLAVQHPGQVRGVAFSPDGTCLATAGLDLTVSIWKATGS